MLLTKECDYGVRILRTLSEGTKKTVDTICKNETIPNKYAYKILKKLEKAGILISIRGRDGGYKLSKELKDIKLFDVAVAVDNSFFIFDCVKAGVAEKCPNNSTNQCNVHQEFVKIQNVLKEEFLNRNMHDVIFG